MIEHINFAKEMQVPETVLVENGDIVKLYPGIKPEVYDRAPSGKLFLDGSISVDEDSKSIKERKNLSSNGFLDVTILINSNGDLHDRPVLTFVGLPVIENDEFKFGLEEEIDKTARTFSFNNKKQQNNIIDTIKVVCKKYSKEKTGKKPITNVNLVRI